jgi:hypothetical protein
VTHRRSLALRHDQVLCLLATGRRSPGPCMGTKTPESCMGTKTPGSCMGTKTPEPDREARPWHIGAR